MLKGQSKVKAVYAIPTNLKITYSSWEKCRSVGESLVPKNIIYYLNETEKINEIEKFLATYELKGIE